MPPTTVGRIRHRAGFRALQHPDGRGADGPLRVAFVRTGAGFPQVAYAVGKRTGNAVLRNRVRRRLREAVRTVAGELPAGAYLVRAGAVAADLPYGDLVRSVRTAMSRASQGHAEEKP